jgi:hypothetical protein
MDHILAIQETVHENRESIPTGVVTNVMRECQQAYKALPKLWKVHYCEVWAVSKNSVATETKTRIVEECATLNLDHWYWFKVLDTGKILPADRQKDIKGSRAAHNGDGRVRVITKVEPFLKRAREVDPEI